MRIDFHTHDFPEAVAQKALEKLSKSANVAFNTNGTRMGLVNSMKANGIDYSVLLPVATSPKQTNGINEIAIETCKHSSENGLISFGGIHPDNEDYISILNNLKANGVKGIKIHPVFQGYNIDDIKYLRIIDKANELGMIVITHAGFDVGFPYEKQSSVNNIIHMLDEIKPDKMVLAHMGGWGEWENVPWLLAKHKVYIDTSFSIGGMTYFEGASTVWKDNQRTIKEEVLEEIKKLAGIEYILYGSDSPWSDQGRAMDTLKGFFNEEELKLVCGDNAAKLLDL